MSSGVHQLTFNAGDCIAADPDRAIFFQADVHAPVTMQAAALIRDIGILIEQFVSLDECGDATVAAAANWIFGNTVRGRKRTHFDIGRAAILVNVKHVQPCD